MIGRPFSQHVDVELLAAPLALLPPELLIEAFVVPAFCDV